MQCFQFRKSLAASLNGSTGVDWCKATSRRLLLLLAFVIAAWMTVSRLIEGMQATERLVRDIRKARDFRDQISQKKIESLYCAKLSSLDTLTSFIIVIIIKAG